MYQDNDIFIGRERELEAFEDSLERIKGPKPNLFQRLFWIRPKDKAADRPFPRVFLFYGEGGFGKTELLHQCIQRAESRDFKVIHLDWDDLERGSGRG